MTSQSDLDDLASAQKWDAEQLKPMGFRAFVRGIFRGLLVRLLKSA